MLNEQGCGLFFTFIYIGQPTGEYLHFINLLSVKTWLYLNGFAARLKKGSVAALLRKY